VILDAALRGQPVHPHDLERRYPLEALIIRNELASGQPTTPLELVLLKSRAAALVLRLFREPQARCRGSQAMSDQTVRVKTLSCSFNSPERLEAALAMTGDGRQMEKIDAWAQHLTS
jgi:hypothetical protein